MAHINYQITVDLKKLPYAEETMFECEDGETRAGIFIPYEENGVYRSPDHALFNMSTSALTNDYRRKSSYSAGRTHSIRPYWTRAHKQEMLEKGINQDDEYYGWMAPMRTCGQRKQGGSE